VPAAAVSTSVMMLTEFSTSSSAAPKVVDAATPLEDALSSRNQSRRRMRRRGGNGNSNSSRNDNDRSKNKKKMRGGHGRNHHRAATARQSSGPIRLSKRMSELDLCSRREADRLIEARRVLIGGVAVEPVLGQKVDPLESDIVILQSDDDRYADDNVIRPQEFDWERMRGDTVVLHKPRGYVSGQPDYATVGGKGRHEPAVRLLTRGNLEIQRDAVEDRELQATLSDGNYLHFARRFGYDKMHTKKGPRLIRQPNPNADDFDKKYKEWWNEKNDESSGAPRHDATLCNYVPAGRLDLDSTGLLIFTKNGVIAKKLVSPHSLIEKEYIVDVEPVQSLTRVEMEMGMTSLPEPTRDLRPLLRGGAKLFGEQQRKLKPVVEAEWMDNEDANTTIVGKDGSRIGSRIGGTLRIVLKEGMKRHIRRACRELLGMHVVTLKRMRIGNIRLDIPEGKWRPLREEEAKALFFSASKGR